jgi:hypothetical protein
MPPVRVRQVLLEQARADLAHQPDERRLARLDRLPAQIHAVEFEQVEGGAEFGNTWGSEAVSRKQFCISGEGGAENGGAETLEVLPC